MMPESRTEILHNLKAMSDLHPSWRLCQMVANVGFLAGANSPSKLAELGDREFLSALRGAVRRRKENLAGEPTLSYPGDTLPTSLPAIVRGLGDLSERYPELPFVPLVLQVAEWTKEFAPFDFWDVEDEDFLRAILSHLKPQAV
jgi:hypothetical protein